MSSLSQSVPQCHLCLCEQHSLSVSLPGRAPGTGSRLPSFSCELSPWGSQYDSLHRGRSPLRAMVKLRGIWGVLGPHTLHSTTLPCTSRQIIGIAMTAKTDTSKPLDGREAKSVWVLFSDLCHPPHSPGMQFLLSERYQSPVTCKPMNEGVTVAVAV